MTETVVHVTTLSQWKSVLDVWFKQGCRWGSTSKDRYYEERFGLGSRQLILSGRDIGYFSDNDYDQHDLIEYSEFIYQQKEDNKMTTYYVTQEQLDLINTLHEELYSLDELLNRHTEAKAIFEDLSILEGSAVLRYLGGDDTIEFNVKEHLYRLWRVDDEGDKVYMTFNLGTPDWDSVKDYAFTAPLEEIKKHKTVSWEIEEVK